LAEIEACEPSAVERLRAAGLPERLVRAIIQAQVDEQFKAREAALYADPNRAQYWKRSYTAQRWGPTDRLKALDLRREKQALLEKLVGKEDQPDRYSDSVYSFLPSNKVEALRALDEDYSAMQSNVRGDTPVSLLPADREKLAYLEKEKRRELTELLTPEELQDYDLRRSQTASRLKSAYGFNATEQEFLAMYNLQRPLDEKYAADGFSPMVQVASETRKARDAEQAAVDVQIKAALGDQRYAEFQRAKDYDFQTINKIASRLNLPPEKAVEAYTIKAAFEQRATGLDRQLSRDERQKAITALSSEAEAQLSQVLGPKGLEVYKQYGSLFRRLPSPVVSTIRTN
jgi:hypothetical protein